MLETDIGSRRVQCEQAIIHGQFEPRRVHPRKDVSIDGENN